MAGSLTIGGMAGGLSGSKVVGPLTMVGDSPVDSTVAVVLASGDNTVAVPAGASAFVLVLPLNGTVAVKVRTNLNSADVGLPVGSDGWLAGPLATGVTSLVLNAAAGGVSVEVTFV